MTVNISDYHVDSKRLYDPLFWFMKAWSFASASQYILGEFLKIKDGDPIDHRHNAINATPYLTGLAIELFMKGYLIHKGVRPEVLRGRKVQHDLKILRLMCLKFNDTRFLNNDLVFITDNLGVILMKDGGIRYPDKIPLGIYFTEFDNALKILQLITGEVTAEKITYQK